MKLTRSGKMIGTKFLLFERRNLSVSTILRYNEYYNMQNIFDELYELNKKDEIGNKDLYSLITSRNNILLAYRNIKNNTGSKTCGVDNKNIEDFKILNEEEFITDIINYVKDFKPDPIRRVYIPKRNGDLRPLGIPTMKDRLVQQMFKQILEPICEAKFHKHSYGFRPNRSTHHAIARCQYMINSAKYHYVVDIDIKGFFDNVNHRKLIKQLYNIGVKDKRVLTIINKMLKTKIEGEGIPEKGTPQGGILSPLLSNVVLNDLDWWISNQYETFKTKKQFSFDSGRLSVIRKSKLKKMFIVRYADDFKIFTDSYNSAEKIYHAVKGYLKDNLDLDISEEKCKITNLRKRNTEFLGYEIKAVKKKNKYVANSHISKKNKELITNKLKEKISNIKKKPNYESIRLYNSYVLGIMNYFRYATHVNIDFGTISYRLNKTLYNKLKKVGKYGLPVKPPDSYKKIFKNNYKTYCIGGTYLYPLSDIKTVNAMNFSQDICNYTKEGREKIYKSINKDLTKEIYKMTTSIRDKTIEYYDNKISKYSMQKGLCNITGKFLTCENLHCHHITPKHLGGTDKFNNLVIIDKEIHKLIHASDLSTINKYLSYLKLTKDEINKVNKYREKCNLFNIVI